MITSDFAKRIKAVNLFEPLVFRLVLCRSIVQSLLIFIVMLYFIGKHSIIYESYAAEGLCKHSSLFTARVYSEFVGFIHSFSP